MQKKPTQNIKHSRAPIVAVMGHIDHGKSTLLDYIRKTNVTAGEAGGITQHVSAYEVVHNNTHITFLDTPGHEAFQAMRERGAAIADIAILVVAADDGVKTQTIEALKAINESNTPYIVAINKIDKAGASVDKAKQTLAEQSVLVEGYGGTIPCVALSAKTGEGVNDLLDMIGLVTEMEELTDSPTEPATGYVLESSLDPRTGALATLIIRSGKLSVGDCVAAGKHLAKVKKLENFLGESIKEAHASSPVRIYGFTTVPKAGELFTTFANKKDAETYCEQMQHTTLEQAPDTEVAGTRFELPIAIKTDAFGTLEAVKREVEKLATEKVRPTIIQSGIGAITENDVRVASASSHGIVLGFTVKVERPAQDLADKLGITVATFDIIYKLSEWLAEEIEKRAPREQVEETVGKVKILKLFAIDKGKQVIGGEVLEGVARKDHGAKIMRRNNEVGRCRIVELQKDRSAASEVHAGSQCGIQVKCDIDVAAGDVLEVFAVVER